MAAAIVAEFVRRAATFTELIISAAPRAPSLLRLIGQGHVFALREPAISSRGALESRHTSNLKRTLEEDLYSIHVYPHPRVRPLRHRDEAAAGAAGTRSRHRRRGLCNRHSPDLDLPWIQVGRPRGRPEHTLGPRATTVMTLRVMYAPNTGYAVIHEHDSKQLKANMSLGPRSLGNGSADVSKARRPAN